jgi:hypothetical protein
MGFGPLMTVDGMGGGAGSDTTRGMTVDPSPLCDVEPSGDSDCGMGWATGGPVEVSTLLAVGWAAAMSSEVIERAWLSIDTGCDDVATRAKGSRA